MTSKKKIAIILVVLIVVTAMSIAILFGIQCAFEDEISVALALEYSGIDKNEAYKLLDIIEKRFDDLDYLLNGYKNDKDFLTSEEDVEKINGILKDITTNVSDAELAKLLYALLNKRRPNGLSGISAAIKYLDTNKINAIKNYKLFTNSDTLIDSETVSSIAKNNKKYKLTEDELRKFTASAYAMSRYVLNTSNTEKLRIIKNVMLLFNKKFEEVSYGALIDAVVYLAKGLSTLGGVENAIAVINKLAFFGTNESMTAFSESPVFNRSIINILKDLSNGDALFIAGDYPNIKRVVNNAFYFFKTRCEDFKLNKETIIGELSDILKTFFKNSELTSQSMLKKAFEISRNVDEDEFSKNEEEFWKMWESLFN